MSEKEGKLFPIYTVILLSFLIHIQSSCPKELNAVALSPVKELQDPLNWRLGGHQSRSGRCGEEKKT
jgi:hypothetical protein